jgi:3-methyl-2-oxobutanoate hydroxymethyltransferase
MIIVGGLVKSTVGQTIARRRRSNVNSAMPPACRAGCWQRVLNELAGAKGSLLNGEKEAVSIPLRPCQIWRRVRQLDFSTSRGEWLPDRPPDEDALHKSLAAVVQSLAETDPERSPVTVPRFVAMKAAGRKISMLTAYDFTLAALLDSTGIEGILVGDSLGMVVQGHNTTLPVTLDQIIYHAEMVGRAVRHALTVVDLPFPSGHLGTHEAVRSAGRILKETRCQAVKLEGGAEQADVIAALVSAGIPVMAHCGLRPQSVHVLGGYKVQREAQRLLADARAAAEAGAFAMVLECIPAELASQVTAAVSVPTIGIGAGAGCDGQVLVTHDMLGLTQGYVPRFVKPYSQLRDTIRDAVGRYREEVRSGEFPDEKQSFT